MDLAGEILATIVFGPIVLYCVAGAVLVVVTAFYKTFYERQFNAVALLIVVGTLSMPFAIVRFGVNELINELRKRRSERHMPRARALSD